MLALLLFAIYITNLVVNVGGRLGKFVDDTRISSVADNEGGYLRLQQDLEQLGKRTFIQINVRCCILVRQTRAG